MTKNQLVYGGIGIGVSILFIMTFYFTDKKTKPPRPHDYDVSTKRYVENRPLKTLNIDSDEVYKKSKASRYKELTNADSRLAATINNRATGKTHTKNRRKHSK